MLELPETCVNADTLILGNRDLCLPQVSHFTTNYRVHPSD